MSILIHRSQPLMSQFESLDSNNLNYGDTFMRKYFLIMIELLLLTCGKNMSFFEYRDLMIVQNIEI